jgi:prepilin-type N-terminal cleavage/methylation domain-containing protein
MRFCEAFTLIELLVVTAILAVLLTLLVTAFKSAPEKARIALAQTELAQMVSAIQDFKETLGFYPPDNPNSPAMAPLYFELLGTTNNGNNYVTLDGSGQIGLTDINAQFSRPGFVNMGTQAHSTDEKRAPMPFVGSLRPAQVGQPVTDKPLIKILVCSIEWPPNSSSAPISNSVLNPWCYVSSHPTNNTGSFDLWADVPVGSRIYRVSNWNKNPEIVR